MANPPSEDIKDILVGAGIGTFAGTSGWGIYISREPETPDTVVTIYDTGGDPPSPKFLLDFPTVQVRIRGARQDYKNAFVKAQSVKDALLGVGQTTVNGTLYVGITQIGDINFIAYDDSERPIFTTNWQIIREPTTGTHRTTIA